MSIFRNIKASLLYDAYSHRVKSSQQSLRPTNRVFTCEMINSVDAAAEMTSRGDAVCPRLLLTWLSTDNFDDRRVSTLTNDNFHKRHK